MKVILREDLQGVGNIGDILEVAPGYARNFLFPRNKAVEATGRSLKAIEHAKRVIAEKARKEKTVLEEVARKVSAIAVTIPVQIGKDDKLFGAVTADRKSTRLNSSHSQISYAVFCLKKKKSPLGPEPRIRLHPSATKVPASARSNASDRPYDQPP